MFQATPEGAGVQFETSFAASTEQSRAVESGLPADVAGPLPGARHHPPDRAGAGGRGLGEDEYDGMVTDSVVVFIVRPGNPKGIAAWDDLLREGVEVITPNALTSGGARWNIMAAWGAQLEQGKSEEEAQEYLRAVLHATCRCRTRAPASRWPPLPGARAMCCSATRTR